MTGNKNKTVYDFITKRMKIQSSLELQELIDDFLKQCADAVYDLQVWPTSHEILCRELTFTCNYLIALSSCHRGNAMKCSHIEIIRVEDFVLHTLHRVRQCICNPQTPSKARFPTRSNGDTVARQMMHIISSLENPIIHFKGLAIMGHLLALSCFWCVYTKLINECAEEAFAGLTQLKHLASESVLKEKLLHYQGLLLCCPVDGDQDCDEIVPSVEDMVSIVFVAWEKPNNLSLEHQPWKWLFLCLECKTFIKEKEHDKVMTKLYEALQTDLDPEIKARILCLFADCYNKQGCHQLAIQTYRDVLQVDNKCSCVLWYLSSIYQSLEKHDLELESLNLLVAMLSDAEGADQTLRFTFSLDEILWSIFSPIKNITLPMAIYTFAKRCFQLKRYKEAAEQYFSLIKKLQSQAIFPQFIGENCADVDISQMLVETAEALLMDKRLKDCLTISDHVCSCISVNDSIMLPSEHSKSWDPFDDMDDSPRSSSSSDIFLSSISPHRLKSSIFAGTKESAEHDLSISKPLFGKELKRLTDVEEFSAGSRKRLRSDDAKQAEEIDAKNEKHLLKARALLCKSDALIMTEGFTDQSVACLTEALDVLLNQPRIPGENQLDGSIHSPCSKRQRISSDSANNFLNQRQENSAREKSRPDSWMSLTLNTALRMAKASFERKRFSSVINSCLLALQLDADNITAVFLKTVALSTHQATKMKYSTDWLQIRGVTDLHDVKKLQINLRDKEALEKTQTNTEVEWWHVSEKDIIGLDIKCLHLLLDTKRKQSK